MTRHRLLPDVIGFRSNLWQVNSLAVRSNSSTLLIDPSLTPSELAAIRHESPALGRPPCYLLVTHAHYDHTCGIPYFPEAKVLMSKQSARRITSGAAQSEMGRAAVGWGISWHGKLRVDEIIEQGAHFELDGIHVLTIDGRGHSDHGLVYLLPDVGVAMVGDYLSTVLPPNLGVSASLYLSGLKRIMDALQRHKVSTVIPGHGPTLDLSEACSVGEADIRYVEYLQRAGEEAVSSDMPSMQAMLHLFKVRPPRPAIPEFAVFGLHLINCQLTLAELRPDADVSQAHQSIMR